MYESKRLFTYTHIYVYVCSFKASIIFLRLVLVVALYLIQYLVVLASYVQISSVLAMRLLVIFQFDP